MKRIDSSFRDPDGYMFEHDGELYRAVSYSYKVCYDHLQSSGLYNKLVDRGLIIPFVELDPHIFGQSNLYKILKPKNIEFISYPYEWAFNMLKDAALLTLEIQKLALENGMSLKDASAFNIQFQNGKPIFIDTLSFELYSGNSTWVAYRQFCQHFLAPLALMAHVDPDLSRMFIIHIDGIPLNLTTKMLPYFSRFKIGLYLHIFLHARAQKKHENSNIQIIGNKRNFSYASMKILLEGLTSTVENQTWEQRSTEWINYTDESVHRIEYRESKKLIINELLDKVKPKIVWDFGANTGYYSRIAANKGCQVISFDVDPECVEKNYQFVKKQNEINILPLLLDLSNPSPYLGWGGTERLPINKRGKPNLLMALAIIHHLAISCNIPLESIAFQFAKFAEYLIIEFVPKEDEKVKLMLQNRKDVFNDYSQTMFEKVFSRHFVIEQCVSLECSQRKLYLMKTNSEVIS